MSCGRVPSSLRQPPRLERVGSQRWLVSAGGGVELRQNVSATLEAERDGALLLVAVAGFSSLVTSTLLRPVLRAGLLEPLEVLSRALAAAEPDAALPERIAVAEQPAELWPIANAFNALHAAWWTAGSSSAPSSMAWPTSCAPLSP